MTYENTGRLFKNDRRTSDKAPDYTGDFTDENGKKWRLAAWLKDGQRGKWMSLKVSEFEQRDNKPSEHAEPQQSAPSGDAYYDSQEESADIPF